MFLNQMAFRFPQPGTVMRFDGERYVSGFLGEPSWGDIQSEHYHRYLFALQFCAGKDVIDIASGEGYGSCCLSQVAKSVIAVDASVEAVHSASRNYQNDRVSFIVGKAQEIPVIDSSADVIVSFETLEHFEEHEAFAAEVKRLLRPSGILVISSPNRAIYTDQAGRLNEWHRRELYRSEFTKYLSDNFAHVQMFAQRPLAGSVIAGDEGRCEGRPEGFILQKDGIFNRTEGVPYPPFFVAVASDAELPEVRPSVLQNPALLSHVSAQAAEAAAQRDAAIAARHAALASLAEVRQRYEELVAETRTLRDNLLNVTESTTWKATFPLRQLASALPANVRTALRSAARTGWSLAHLHRRRDRKATH